MIYVITIFRLRLSPWEAVCLTGTLVILIMQLKTSPRPSTANLNFRTGDPAEVLAVMKAIHNYSGPSYLRLGKAGGGFP